MKPLNLAASWESMTKGDRRGPVHTDYVRCIITVRHVPWYQFPAFNGELKLHHRAPGTLELGFNLRSRRDPLSRLFWCVVESTFFLKVGD